jgi:tetratricopeptide (TPR) repeat protein
MMNRTALVPPNRLPRRRELAITVTLAAGFAAAATCGHRQPTLASACRAASEGSQPQTAALCLASFVLTNDPATGALAARALEAQGGAEDIIERLAAAIGDSNAGADAWLAAGNARKAHDPARAVIAYRRALDHRAPDNVSGRIRDTIGLLLAFAEQGDYQNATQKAADAYELASRATSDQDRGLALLDIALLLIEMIVQSYTRNPQCEVHIRERPREALVENFNGRLLDQLLKAVGESPSTDREQRI